MISFSDTARRRYPKRRKLYEGIERSRSLTKNNNELASYRKTGGWAIAGAKRPSARIDKNDRYACYRILREPLSHVEAQQRLTPGHDCEDWSFRGSLDRNAVR